MRDIHRKIHANEEVSEAEWAAWRAWHGIGSSSSGGQKRKRKKRRKRKLPRNSSCPRLAARHFGRYGPDGHLRRDTVSASVARVVRTWKPGLSTSHWYLVRCLTRRRSTGNFGVFWEITMRNYFYGPLYLSGVPLEVRVFGFFWKMTSGISVCSTPWFDSGYTLGVSLQRPWSRTAENCGLYAVAVHCWSSSSLSLRRGSSPWSRLLSSPWSFPSCSTLPGGRCPYCACRS